MSTATAPAQVATPQLSTEQKIVQAAAIASQAAALFNPVVAASIQAGVAVEPLVSGFVQMILAIFKHHATQAVSK